jgi:Reverse transcriptase (RNA-dependent DNA polymerase)
MCNTPNRRDNGLAWVQYLNVRGLTPLKLGRIIDSLLIFSSPPPPCPFPSSFDLQSRTSPQTNPSLLFISEHWFQNHNDLLQSPFFLCSSPRPAQQRQVGHENGGLAVLVHPIHRGNVHVIHTHEFFITIRFLQRTITAVYFPPRLSDADIENICMLIPQCDMILGDTNVRYGAQRRDPQSRNRTRGNTLDIITRNKGMDHLVPENGFSGNDHVFSRVPFTWNYRTDIETQTDHGCIIGQIDYQTQFNRQQNSRIQHQFSFSLLSEKPIRDHICIHWDGCYAENINNLVDSSTTFLQQFQLTWEEKADIISRVYEPFLASIIQTASRFLMQYDPASVLNNNDPTRILTNKSSNTRTIRAFKRSQRRRQLESQITATNLQIPVEEEAFQKMQQLFEGPVTDPPQQRLQFNDDLFNITAENITTALKRYSNAKSGGPDKVHTRLLKCLSNAPRFIPILTKMFRLFAACSVTPVQWNSTKIYLILKSTDDTSLRNSRPITLSNILRRLFEKLLLKSFQPDPGEDPPDWCKLNIGQGGFRKGHSTSTHAILSSQLSRGGKPITIFLDLKGAYDRVPHQKMLDILETRNCPPQIVSLLFSLLFFQNESSVIVNLHESIHTVKRYRGLLQGSLLSPFLFNLFIDALGNELNDGLDIPRALLYADDIALKASTPQEAQDMLHVCHEWAVSHGMIWGIPKCGVVGCNVPLFLADSQIPIVTSYKYLGIPHTASGLDWKQHLQTRQEKEIRFFTATSDLARAWPISSRLLLFKVFARPLGEYSLAPALRWLERQSPQTKSPLLDLLKNTHHHALLWITGSNSNQAISESLLGIGTMTDRFNLLHASFARHLHSLDENHPLHRLRLTVTPFQRLHHSFIIDRCFDSNLWTQYCQYRRDHPRPGPLNSFIRRSWIARQNHLPSPLIQSVRNPSPTVKIRDHNGIDRALIVPDTGTQSAVLNWRLNKTLPNRDTCRPCLSNHSQDTRLTRGHITRCPAFQQFASTSFPVLFQAFQEQCTREPVPASFNFIDYVLNSLDFDSFLQSLHFINTSLK